VVREEGKISVPKHKRGIFSSASSVSVSLPVTTNIAPNILSECY